MGASSASAINMMDTMDDHVYCNSTTTTVAAPVTVTSPSAVTTSTTTTTVAAGSRELPKLAIVAQESCNSDDQYQQSSPSQYSPSPSSPLPSSPQPASPRPSSPVPSSSSVPSSPAPSSPLPSMEDETLMMEDDETEPDATYEDERNVQHNNEQAAGENEAEAEFVNDVFDYGAHNGNDAPLVNPDESEYDEEESEEDGDDADGYYPNNVASDSGVLTDDQQGDDPGDGNNDPGMAETLVAVKEVKQLQSILLLHLDLIQEQGDQILNKDKMIIRLKDENEVLKHQLDMANRRVSLMMLQLQQNGLALPVDEQQPMILQPPKQEGTVSPLTIRSQMENGRLRTIIMKSSSSPPFVSSSVADGALFGPCLPIRNPEVSSTVSPAKEELPDDIVLQGDELQSPYYNDEDDNDGDDDEQEEEEEDEEVEDDDEEEEEFHTENNEVDGEIFLNYSKSDDDESLSPQMNDDFDEQQDEEEEDEDDYNEQQEQQQQQQYVLLQQPQQVYENYDGLQQAEVMDDEEGGYESNEMGEEDDNPMQYVSDDQGGNYDDTPMVMIDDGAVEVKMETDSPASQESSQDSQESQDSQDSQGSQVYQEPQNSSMQHAPLGNGLEVNVPFVESTVGSEGEQPEDEGCKVVKVEGAGGMPVEDGAQSTEVTTGGTQDSLELEYGCTSEPTEGSSENGREKRHNPGGSRQRFNPTLHCPSGNSSDGSVAAKRNCKPTPYMVTQKQYISCSWKDDAVTAELEKLQSNEAAELEIPSWTVIEDDDEEPETDHPPAGASATGEEEPVSASEPSREDISDGVYTKRHMKLEIDERRRKKWDVQRIREQKNIERLKKRQLKEQPTEQESAKTITTLYPTVDTLKSIQVTDDVPVQAFGELIPLLPTNGDFSLPWNQLKAGPSFANPQSSCSTGLLQPHHHHHHHHTPSLPGPSGTSSSIGLLLETKTKFIHRLAPSLQAQKQRFTKRIKKEL